MPGRGDSGDARGVGEDGKQVSYEDLAKVMVKVAPDKTKQPRPELAAKYAAAMETYRARLKELYFAK